MRMKTSRIIASVLAASLTVNFCGCSTPFDFGKKDIREFTAYFDMNGTELPADNDIQNIIAEKTGVICHETWKDPNKPEASAIEEMIIANNISPKTCCISYCIGKRIVTRINVS